MKALHLKIGEVGKDSWNAELWAGFPGTPGYTRIAGGASTFTRADLEADGLPETHVVDLMRTEDQPNADFTRIGERLGQMLGLAGVLTAWEGQMAAGGCRTYLEVHKSLRPWPWELLNCNVEANLYKRFFESDAVPIVRYDPPPRTLPPATGVIRILLVSGQKALDNTVLAREELLAIRKAFHGSPASVVVEWLESPASAADLTRRITEAKPHVIHFIGHGSQASPQSEFSLLFEGGNGKWTWGANSIHAFFAQPRWKPRLIVLNACHSAQQQPDSISVSRTLLLAGIPAVIGAQATVRIDYARLFASKFYSGLAAGDPFDIAMAGARAFLTQPGTPFATYDRRHWALPVLTVSAPIEDVLSIGKQIPRVITVPGFKDVFERPGRFVNRAPQRRMVLTKFDGSLNDGKAARGVIVRGRSQIGKSWFLRRSISDLLNDGYWVRYAEVAQAGDKRDCLEVLRAWSGVGNIGCAVQSRPAGNHFDDFDLAFSQARASQSAPDIKAVYAAFKGALHKLRGDAPLALVLDRMRKDGYQSATSQDFREGIFEEVLRPIALGKEEMKGIVCILVDHYNKNTQGEQTADFDEFGLGAAGFEEITISSFDLKDADNLFDELSDFSEQPRVGLLRSVFTDDAEWAAQDQRLPDPEIRTLVERRLRKPI